jgi:hypothetical protein
MSRIAELPGKKLAAVLHPGESLIAAAEFQYWYARGEPSEEFSAFHRLHGRDPEDDLAHVHKAAHGFVGATESRLILARSPLLFGVKQKHVFVDEALEACSLAWYDKKLWGGAEHRVVHLMLAEGRFASFAILMDGLGVRAAAREAWQASARNLVEAFGDRAQQVSPPPCR